MRFLLLLTAAAISAAIVFFNYLFLSGQIAYVPYALVSMAVAVTMTFVAFHFIYLYYAKRKENKRQSKAFSQKEKEWEKSKTTCPEPVPTPSLPPQAHCSPPPYPHRQTGRRSVPPAQFHRKAMVEPVGNRYQRIGKA